MLGPMRRETRVDPRIGGKVWSRGADAWIAALAAAQHGVVSRLQLLDYGLGPKAIDHRIANGRLHVVHRGVYAVGHPRLTREGRWMAAVLAGGADAVLSHRSAGVLWGILQSARIEVTTPAWKPSREGVVFRSSSLQSDERTEREGIPVTMPSRTLLDLGQVLGDQALERAFREAERLRLTDANSVADLLGRYPGRRGCAAVRRLTGMKELYAGVTRSELEEWFRLYLRDHDLPQPEWNVRIDVADATLEVDCLWRDQRVVVELDGYGYHAHRAAFERDRVRDRLLQLAGFTPIRVTWKVLRDDPSFAHDLATILAREQLWPHPDARPREADVRRQAGRRATVATGRVARDRVEVAADPHASGPPRPDDDLEVERALDGP